MAKKTLLQMTQEILSRLDSDEVNSISDTVESAQVAKIIEHKYYEVMSRGDLPSQSFLFQLDASGDPAKPTQMTVPAHTTDIEWIKYLDVNPANSQSVSQFGAYSHGLNLDINTNPFFITTSTTSNTFGTGAKTFTVGAGLTTRVSQGVLCISGANSMFGTLTSYSGTTMVLNITSVIGSGTSNSWTITSNAALNIPGYKYVTVLPMDQFFDMINRFNPNESNVGSFTFTEGAYSFNLYFKNDKQPQYCTIIENNFVLFDSFDSVFDTTLQSSKNMVFGQIVANFTQDDSFIPDIDDNQFPLLFNEALGTAFVELKQTVNPAVDRELKRQWTTLQREKSLDNVPSYFDQLANYGRVPRTGGYSGGGYGAYKWMRQAGP